MAATITMSKRSVRVKFKNPSILVKFIISKANLATILYNIKVLCLQIKKKAVYLQPANYAVTYKVFINNSLSNQGLD